MQIKQLAQKHVRTIQICGAVAAGLMLMATAVKPQQVPAVGPVWEYSLVAGTPDEAYFEGSGNATTHYYRATICYAAANGCKSEQVTSSSGSGSNGNDALMMAAAKLGEKGWEMTSTTEVSSGTRYQRVMYFKRLKSVLNRDGR